MLKKGQKCLCGYKRGNIIFFFKELVQDFVLCQALNQNLKSNRPKREREHQQSCEHFNGHQPVKWPTGTFGCVEYEEQWGQKISKTGSKILLQVIIFLKNYLLYLKGRVIQRGGEIQREIFHLFIHSPDALSALDQAEAKSQQLHPDFLHGRNPKY